MLLRAKGHADNNYSGTEDIAGATGSKLVYTLTLLSGGCRADSMLVSTVDMLLWESSSSFWQAKRLANSVASLLLVFLSVFPPKKEHFDPLLERMAVFSHFIT